MLDPELENNRRLPVSAAIEISRLPEQYQLPLAERVMSREVNLRGLRGAVKEIATTHGIPVRERRKDAHDQRRTIERKIDAFLRQSIDLKDRMEEVPISSLRHWSNERAKAYLGQLTQAEENVLKARKVINAVLRNP
jgi:hypothetical protein